MSLADDLKKFDFKALDWKNVGSFPLAVRAVLLFGAFGVMVGVVYWFFIKDSLASWDRAKAEESSLRQVFSEKANKATNLEAYKAQLEQMDRQFGELLRQLPGKTEIENLAEEIAREALSSNLTQELFKPQNEQLKEFYAELPIQMRLTGDYHEFGEFVSRVSSLPRIVTLHDIKVLYDEKNKDKASIGMLTMELTAKTYRYLEQDEIDAQQAAAKAAADKGKGKKKGGAKAPAKK
jgi:type IV pilus assembly protein PilO